MRRLAGMPHLLAFFAAALLAIAPSGASVAQPPQPASARLRIFDEIWSQIRDLYYDPGFNGADWEMVRARYRPAAASAPDDRAFQDVLRAMTAELRDSHTRVLTREQAENRRREQASSAGVILYEVGGQPVIFAVRPESPAAQAGLRPGMRVSAVNGVPVRDALARARAEVGASSSERAALVLAWLRLIAGDAGQPLILDIVGPDGAARRVSLTRQTVETRPVFEARRLAGGILLVRFDRFREPVARLLREALLQNAGAPGLILDLRSNTGGDGREGMRAIGPLLAQPTLVARLQTRTGRAPSALMGLVRLPLELVAGESGGQLFAGPIVILTNAGTASTSEVIAASLQERGRARVIGSQSCGCALGVLRHRRLPDGRALAISEVGLMTGLGRRVEGAGVTPDRVVEPTREDFQAGRDRALEAAMDELRTSSSRPSRPPDGPAG